MEANNEITTKPNTAAKVNKPRVKPNLLQVKSAHRYRNSSKINQNSDLLSTLKSKKESSK